VQLMLAGTDYPTASIDLKESLADEPTINTNNLFLLF